MGHEGAGVVDAVGPGVGTLRVGQPVALSWLVPCGVCRWCLTGRPWACPVSPSFRHRLPDGATALTTLAGEPVLSYCGIGTMAATTVVPEAAAIPLPDGVDPAVAALIGCCVSTGVGAVLKTAEVPAGATVAVIGLGGVGLSCVMGAVLAGAARIVAIDRVAAKLEVAREVGATDGILASDDPAATIAALRDLTDGGPDVVFEAIGRTATVELAIESLPVGGTAVLVGMTPVDGPRLVRRLSRSSTAAAGSSGPTTASPCRRSTSRATPRCTWPAACRSTDSSTGGSGSTTSRVRSTACGRAMGSARSSSSTDGRAAGRPWRSAVQDAPHVGPARVQADGANVAVKVVDLPGPRLLAPRTDRFTSSTLARPS